MVNYTFFLSTFQTEITSKTCPPAPPPGQLLNIFSDLKPTFGMTNSAVTSPCFHFFICHLLSFDWPIESLPHLKQASSGGSRTPRWGGIEAPCWLRSVVLRLCEPESSKSAPPLMHPPWSQVTMDTRTSWWWNSNWPMPFALRRDILLSNGDKQDVFLLL